jgi:hypothetical protein
MVNQDNFSSSSNSTPSSSGHKLTSESYKAGEKGSSSNRAATESSHSSGGSYLDFDFF